MDYAKLKELNSSKRIAEAFTLEELITGARQYEIDAAALHAKAKELEAEFKRIQINLAFVHKEMGDISFGGLLLNAIGIKLRDRYVL